MRINPTGDLSLACSQAMAPYLRVVRDSTYGLVAAGAEDNAIGTLKQRHIVTGLGASTHAPVIAANCQGTRKMVADAAIAAWDIVYGAAGGKVSTTPNTNPIGTAMTAAAADEDYLEVLPLPNMSISSGNEVGGIDIFDDFIGDYPANATALTASMWTKYESNGLGVISSDQTGGVLKFTFDNASEAATAELYMANSPVDIDAGPIFEARVAIYDIGAAALDINIGLASDGHNTDFDSITNYVAFHLDGSALSILAQSADGSTTIAAVDTLVDAVDDTFLILKIDCTDSSDVKLFINGTRVLSGTTFDMSNYTGALTPIIHVEKTSDTSTADVRVDWIRCRAQR